MLQRIARNGRNAALRFRSRGKNQPRQAMQSIDRALEQASEIRYSRNKALADAITTWSNVFPRVAEANGRRFLHEVDDVKDHVPDLTVDMSYLVYRELQLPLASGRTDKSRA